uniref:PDZ domain-containing protein n=1 Tax=Rhizochromulina marina TaxID=1034831 RepID=A0A7S2RPT8_9STRA|mmetsp:Transcript_19246/g.55987  ORF Transcript_19246/g.55987 Transcript_19246/m.55987 type:complete len:172 (+) Transcript_19246:129-644(+)
MGAHHIQGRLIGVNTAIVSPSGSFAGIGFAIPVDTVSRIVTQLVRYGRVKRPSLGLQVAEDQIMQGVLKRVNLQVEGVMVVEVAPGSPAAAPVSGRALSGVQRRSNGSILLGDVVTRVNNSPVKKVEDLLSAVEECEVGSVVELAVKRQGQGPEERVRVRLTEQQQRRSPL